MIPEPELSLSEPPERDEMRRQEILETLTDFVETEILESAQTGLGPTSPLLEWGILNSLSTTRLLAFIHERYGIPVPPDRITGKNFKHLDAITDLVLELHDNVQAQV
jgi:acyl carrier protein